MFIICILKRVKELQQSKQQTILVDMKNAVIDMRNQTRKKFYDYQVYSQIYAAI